MDDNDWLTLVDNLQEEWLAFSGGLQLLTPQKIENTPKMIQIERFSEGFCEDDQG
ncbi:MAG: hypothetical protein WAO19_00925 [Candidatus Kryptoniota bacterium]